jgi:ring-1,2-phenylacetyl-CoA epoxidase subunit PaaD
VSSVAAGRPSSGEVWGWLAEVPDPEIPVISVVDLGIVRDVRWEAAAGGVDELVVSVTPTYSGCPATRVIAGDIEAALRAHGVGAVRIETRLAPAWTTDWLSERGRERLRDFGIAPPGPRDAAALVPLVRRRAAAPAVACPRCGSASTALVSEFGSTPCKAHHKCLSCLEPFDAFKSI